MSVTKSKLNQISKFKKHQIELNKMQQYEEWSIAFVKSKGSYDHSGEKNIAIIKLK